MTVEASDCDLISSFLDLGPLGTQKPVQLKIPHGLKPGSILFITARCENRMCINLKDNENNIVQSLGIRVNKNEITIMDHCGPESQKTSESFKARFSLTCVCEPEGYRIFINGKQLEFFKRTYTNNIATLDIANCQVYKIMYTTIIYDNKNIVSTHVNITSNIDENANTEDNDKKKTEAKVEDIKNENIEENSNENANKGDNDNIKNTEEETDDININNEENTEDSTVFLPNAE